MKNALNSKSLNESEKMEILLAEQLAGKLEKYQIFKGKVDETYDLFCLSALFTRDVNLSNAPVAKALSIRLAAVSSFGAGFRIVQNFVSASAF